jgi:hypothetical protein
VEVKMTDPKGVVIPIWMSAVEEAVAKFRGASVEEQEVICRRLGEKNEEAGAKARELFGLAKAGARSWRRDGGYRGAQAAKPKLGPVDEPIEEPKIEKPEPEPKIEEPRREQKNGPEEAKVPAVVPVLAPAPAWDQAIAAMNREHAIIENVGGKAVIASWEPSTIDPSKRVVVYQNKESFLLRYSNRFVSIEVHDGRGGRATVPLGQWWLGHRDRQQYRGVTFRPAGPKTVNGCLNLWQSWGVKDRTGDWGLIQNHIREVIAGGNKEFADYVERWIAWAIQNPAAQAEVALVLIGPKGIVYVKIIRDLNKIDAFPFNRQRRLCYHALKSTYTSLITAPVSFVGNEQNTVL